MPVESYRKFKLERLKEPGRAESYLKLSLQEALKDGNYAAFFLSLKDVIDARDLTKTMLAEEAGMVRQHLHYVLSGKGNPTFASVVAILKAIGFSFVLVEIFSI